ncbi:MAG TPA: four helix bundle protein [Vicinamibacterales bacterium]|nr:four helix bundle protein [Vicinamibacterales bacterium]
MNAWGEELKARTHKFAVDVIAFVRTLPGSIETRRIRDQLIGAACGVSGNYRAACRARSHREFTAKLGTVLQEADEAEEWLDIIYDASLSRGDELQRLRSESKELRAIFVKANLTARRNDRHR